MPGEFPAHLPPRTGDHPEYQEPESDNEGNGRYPFPQDTFPGTPAKLWAPLVELIPIIAILITGVVLTGSLTGI